jgi:hypothetical protein
LDIELDCGCFVLDLRTRAKGRRKPQGRPLPSWFSLCSPSVRSSEDVLRSDAPKELVFRTEYPLDAQQLRLGFENERPTTYADDVFTLLWSLVFPLDVFDKVIGIVAPFPNQVGSKRCSNYFVQRDKDVRSSEYKLQEDYFCSEYPSLGRNTPGSSEHKTNPSTSSVFSLPKELLLRG